MQVLTVTCTGSSRVNCCVVWINDVCIENNEIACNERICISECDCCCCFTLALWMSHACRQRKYVFLEDSFMVALYVDVSFCPGSDGVV